MREVQGLFPLLGRRKFLVVKVVEVGFLKYRSTWFLMSFVKSGFERMIMTNQNAIGRVLD